jgi:hypothetical protein
MSGHVQCALTQEQGRATGGADHPARVAVWVAIDDHHRHRRMAPPVERLFVTDVSADVPRQQRAEAVIEPDQGSISMIRSSPGGSR